MTTLHSARRFLRQLLPDHCSLDLPWFEYGGAETRDLHQLALRVLRDHDKMLRPRSLPMRLGRRAGGVLWPVNAALRSLAILARLGAETEREFGVGVVTQLRQLMWVTQRFNIAPKAYYKFRLFDAANRERAPQFMQDHELGVALSLIRRRWRAPSERLDHKFTFWQFCADNDLPAIPVFAFGAPGRPIEWILAGELPRGDLILKRTNLASGEGLEHWVHDPKRVRWEYGSRRLAEPELRQHFAASTTRHGAVVQPRIRNHPAMHPIAPGALSGIRVVTVLDEDDTPQVVAATIRVGVGDAIVDNQVQGAIGVRVDTTTGRLGGKGVLFDIGGGWFHRHPDTGAKFCDATVPMWQQAREICLRAHACARELPTVGWDIAITADGPMLVEANTLWGVELSQLGAPLAEIAVRAVQRALATPPSELSPRP